MTTNKVESSNKDKARKAIKEIINNNVKEWRENVSGSFSIVDFGVELQKKLGLPNNIFNRSWNATNLKLAIRKEIEVDNLKVEYFFKDEIEEEFYTFNHKKEDDTSTPTVKINKTKRSKPLSNSAAGLPINNISRDNSIKFVRRLINNKTIIDSNIIATFNKTEFVDKDFIFLCMNHIYERMVQFNGLLLSTADSATKENYVGMKQNLMCAITILGFLNH